MYRDGAQHLHLFLVRGYLRGNYTDPTGHTPGEWIVDQEAAQGVEAAAHKECTVCGEVLETEELEQLYNQATTDPRAKLWWAAIW